MQVRKYDQIKNTGVCRSQRNHFSTEHDARTHTRHVSTHKTNPSWHTTVLQPTPRFGGARHCARPTCAERLAQCARIGAQSMNREISSRKPCRRRVWNSSLSKLPTAPPSTASERRPPSSSTRRHEQLTHSERHAVDAVRHAEPRGRTVHVARL